MEQKGGTERIRQVEFQAISSYYSCLLGPSSSSGTWYCQLHHSAGDGVCVSSLDMSEPMKTADEPNLVDRCNV